MNEISQSASASAKGQVGVVNVEGGLSFSLNPEFKASGFVGRFLSPRKARRSAEAAKEINNAVAESMATYMSLSPTVSPERAYLMAMTGLMFTERQADNLLDILNSASESAKGGADPSAIPDIARDRILRGACEADDESVRSMWERLIMGELEQPGAYTKRAMSILSDMSRDEALIFSKLCSTSIFTNPQSNRSLVAVLRKDNAGGTYNDGLIKVEDLDTLSSLGLITTMTWPTHHLQGDQLVLIEVNGQILPMRNPSGEAKSIVFSQMRYLKEGLILSALCEVGSYEHLPQIVDEVITASGLVNSV